MLKDKAAKKPSSLSLLRSVYAISQSDVAHYAFRQKEVVKISLQYQLTSSIKVANKISQIVK